MSVAVDREFITDAEFCARLSIHRHTARRWRESGIGPRYVATETTGGRRFIRYYSADVDRWLAERERR